MAFVSLYAGLLILYTIRIIQDHLSEVHIIFMAWASFLFINFIRTGQWRKKITGKYLIVAILALSIVTLLVNIKHNPAYQTKTILLTGISLLVIYPIFYYLKSDENKTVIDRYRNLIYATSSTVILAFIISFLSILMGLFKMTHQMPTESKFIWKVFGVRYAEYSTYTVPLLYGLWQSPNQAATVSGVVGLLSLGIYLFQRRYVPVEKRVLYKGKAGQAFLITSFVVQFCYFAMAKSRASSLSVSFGLIVVVLMLIYLSFFSRKEPQNKAVYKSYLKVIVPVAIATILVISGIVASMNPYLKNVGCAPFLYENKMYSLNGVLVQEPCWFTKETLISKIDVTKDDDLIEESKNRGDLEGNSRLRIWSDMLELYKKHPVFGTGAKNTKYYILTELPPKNHKSAGRDIHNSYLDILVFYGIFNFIAWTAFVLIWIVKQVKNRRALFANPLSLFSLWAILHMFGSNFFASDCYVGSNINFFLAVILMGWLDWNVNEPTEDRLTEQIKA